MEYLISGEVQFADYCTCCGSETQHSGWERLRINADSPESALKEAEQSLSQKYDDAWSWVNKPVVKPYPEEMYMRDIGAPTFNSLIRNR